MMLEQADALALQKTRAHYDEFPYQVGSRDLTAYASPDTPMGRFISRIHGGKGMDLGCGPGNLLPTLGRAADYSIGVDLSSVSLKEAARWIDSQHVGLAQANALALPFADASLDFFVAAGSLHHTPEARRAFLEACRLLKKGGRAFVAVYRRRSYYDYLYHTLGALARACERNALTARLINRGLLMPLFSFYFGLGRFLLYRHWQIPPQAHVASYFADQLLNPVVSFHTPAELEEWAREAGVKITGIVTGHAGALLNVQLEKSETPDGVIPN
jgi:ubiquinone/menaquinone biosynthesis C-methylase UbiE